MLLRALPLVLLTAVAGCTTLGKTEVHVETGNQSSGYLSRPMTLTASSDEAIQEVAQGICDNVKAGSDAKVGFVGKIPNPNPVGLGDWGRYHFDCVAQAPAAPKAAAARPSPMAPAAALAPPAPPAPPPSAPPAPQAPATASAPAASADPAHLRACLQQQGLYHVCLGNCLLNPGSSLETLAAQCQQQCAPKFTPSCN